MRYFLCFWNKEREKVHTVLPTIIVEVLDFFFSLSFNSYFRAQDLLKSKCVWCFKMLPFTKANGVLLFTAESQIATERKLTRQTWERSMKCAFSPSSPAFSMLMRPVLRLRRLAAHLCEATMSTNYSSTSPPSPASGKAPTAAILIIGDEILKVNTRFDVHA